MQELEKLRQEQVRLATQYEGPQEERQKLVQRVTIWERICRQEVQRRNTSKGGGCGDPRREV